MTVDDVDGIALALAGTSVESTSDRRSWVARGKAFAWQRPFSKADLKRFGDEAPPAGDILAVRVENLDAKDALLSMALPGFFTIPHFNGYPAVLIALRKARAKDVWAALVEAHRAVSSAPTVAKRTTRARRPREE